jgi:hypothetical protein
MDNFYEQLKNISDHIKEFGINLEKRGVVAKQLGEIEKAIDKYLKMKGLLNGQ